MFTIKALKQISKSYPIRLIFLGVAPIAVVSWLNLKIFLAIKQSGKGAVKDGDSARQGDELRRNISIAKNNVKQKVTNVEFKERCQDETIVRELTSKSDLHLDTDDLVPKQTNIGEMLERNSCDSNWEHMKHETIAKKKKKNERVQFLTLFSIILLFILCNIPRITLLVHQVFIIDTIK
jgi:tRNA U55 pseudouridine synthase TruB